ncbi:MAG: caspase family protein [Sphingobacteriales bacterium]|nr:caspase family protein [Sphingobacteriales bacterium]
MLKSSFTMSRANLYSAHGQADLAIRDLRAGILKAPNNAYYHTCLGQAYAMEGEFDSAMVEYDISIQLDPKGMGAFAGRGQVFSYKGDYPNAIKEFEKCISAPYGEGYSQEIISPMVRTLNFEGAKKYIDMYLASKIGQMVLAKEKYSYYKSFFKAIGESIPNNRYEEALSLLDAVLKSYSSNITETEKTVMFFKSFYTTVLSIKGYCFVKLNRLDEATVVYEQALVINPMQSDVKDALASLGKKKQVYVQTDKTPPLIELISPAPSRSFEIEADITATQITGRVKDESGIANVKINGKDIGKIEEDGLFISKLTLKPGVNTILISATDNNGNTASKTFTINGTAMVKRTEVEIPILLDAAPKYYAILIAENNYSDRSIPSLQNPVKDARELKRILESQYTFNKEDIDTLYNRSREEIMERIVHRCNTLTENDNLVIFYAGHGTAEKDKFGDVDGYWIPISAKRGVTSSYISASDINISLKRSSAKHILIIADACFSGAFTRQLPGDAGKAIQKQYQVASRKVMASGNLEPVPDNSKFLFYLKKNLQGNTEKYMSAKKLFDSFYDAILNNSDNLPQYAAIKNVGDEGGEFVFIKK